jgi:hypothetical protein
MDNNTAADEMKTTSKETTSMDVRQLHSSQQEAMKKIVEFSGESTEFDIDEWLYDLTNLFSLMKLKDETKILETMGKLTGSALRWYQENLTSFDSWHSAEQSLRDRFQEFTSDSQLMQELFELKQEENQTIISFYEKVMRKYKRAKKLVTGQQVVTVLQAGVKNSIKEHLIRKEKDITKPEEWLKLAKEEEYVQKRIQQQRHVSHQDAAGPPYFDSILPTATVQHRPSNTQPPNRHAQMPYHFNAEQIHQYGSNRMLQQHHPSTRPRRQTRFDNKAQQIYPCLICNRNNHPTIKCIYKKENGCFKCGQSDHRIRDCPQCHFFD